MERIMPAEQLNIKINLDINELNANVKKAKTKIGEVAATAERSIPKITITANNSTKVKPLFFINHAPYVSK